METFGIEIPIGKSGIHIKKKNEGKFTASAKKAGESVQEHATHVLNDPHATALQKKRALFAKNAAKWKHEDGAKIHKPDGHRSILDNGWISDKNAKKGYVGYHKTGDKINRVNWDTLQRDPEYIKNYGYYINSKNMKLIEDSLINRKAAFPQRIATLTLVVAESGGRTTPHGDGSFGLVGWRGERAKGLPTSLSGQIHNLMNGLFGNFNANNWNHGGKGTNVSSGKEMLQLYKTSPNVIQTNHAVMKGYVRPEKTEYDKRDRLTSLLRKHSL